MGMYDRGLTVLLQYNYIRNFFGCQSDILKAKALIQARRGGDAVRVETSQGKSTLATTVSIFWFSVFGSEILRLSPGPGSGDGTEG